MSSSEEDERAEEDEAEINLVPLFAEEDEEGEESTDSLADLATATGSHLTLAELDNFRREWKSELHGRRKDPMMKSSSSSTESKEQRLQDAATKLYLEGVDCESRGEMWEAVQRYMGAVRMVPDIENKVYKDPSSSMSQSATYDLIPMRPDSRQRSHSRSRFGFREVGDLTNILQQRIYERRKFFEPEFLDEPCPISLLPVELLSALMRYVVGSGLDVRCLEILSMTSVGFYLLARDEELWHAICRRTFGVKGNDSIEFGTFTSWRQMYITCPHVYLHGVYIGKTTYLRNGEASFQDQFYKPWHIIVYYRMLRFFADGSVIMITSSDPPAQVVGFLKSKTPRLNGVLSGRYWMTEQGHIAAQIVDQEFNMKLRFGDGKKRRSHCVLQLEEYNCTITYLDGKVSHSTLDASDRQAYPPLFFSRVKSYAVPDSWDEVLS